MLKHKNKGYTIEIDLPSEYGYEGYSVECAYKFNKRKGKYLLSMWLKRDIDKNKFRIESQEVDTQYISGTRDTIVDNICRIVEQACATGFFDEHVDMYEYTYDCFAKGSELLDSGRVDDENDCKG